MRQMTVGEAARTVDVSSKAIRLWESKGLIPEATRTEAGYRLFSDTDLAKLSFIRHAKTLGLTLNEIREIIQVQHTGISPCSKVIHAIDAHLIEIDRTLADLHRLRRTLAEAKNTHGTSADSSNMCPIIEGFSEEKE